jgi:asparagine synthase (glutamine-hydrolysing)
MPLLGKRNDLRVRLSGLGGDEWLGATYFQYADLLKQLRIIALLRKLETDRNPPAGFAPFPGYLKTLTRFGILPLVPERLKSVLRPLRRPPRVHPLIAPAFAARTKLAERLSARMHLPRCRSFAQRVLYTTFASGWLPHALEINDRWTAGFRLEARHPFLDRRILEFAFAIPDNQRFRPGVSKFVLRESMRGILPERIRLRSDKADLTEVYAMALITLGGERLFDDLSVVKNGWVDGVVLRGLYRSMAEAFSRRDPSYSENILQLWKVFAVELWFSVAFPGIADKHLAESREASL